MRQKFTERMGGQLVTNEIWDMIAKDQIRKIPRLLAWTIRREREDTGGELGRDEDSNFPESNNSILSTSTYCH